ncbi:hypothetical protein Hanom_Chr11g01019871 [Helianthus anomalus]
MRIFSQLLGIHCLQILPVTTKHHSVSQSGRHIIEQHMCCVRACTHKNLTFTDRLALLVGRDQDLIFLLSTNTHGLSLIIINLLFSLFLQRIFPFIYILLKSKLSFWSMWFVYFCHFSLNLKLFTSVSMWFAFFCHLSTKSKNPFFYC